MACCEHAEKQQERNVKPRTLCWDCKDKLWTYEYEHKREGWEAIPETRAKAQRLHEKGLD